MQYLCSEDYGDPIIKDYVVHKKIRLHFHINSNSKLTMATAAAIISDNSGCKDDSDYWERYKRKKVTIIRLLLMTTVAWKNMFKGTVK